MEGNDRAESKETLSKEDVHEVVHDENVDPSTERIEKSKKILKEQRRSKSVQRDVAPTGSTVTSSQSGQSLVPADRPAPDTDSEALITGLGRSNRSVVMTPEGLSNQSSGNKNTIKKGGPTAVVDAEPESQSTLAGNKIETATFSQIDATRGSSISTSDSETLPTEKAQ